MTEEKTMIVLINVSGFNEMSREEAKNLMRMQTGGIIEDGPEKRLKASDRDQSYLPKRENQI